MCRVSLRLVVLLTALAGINGCTSWQRRDISGGVAPVIASDQPVRVMKSDGSVIVLHQPRVVGDSLIGGGSGAIPRLAIALADIRSVEQRRVSAARTGGLVAGTAGGVFVLFATVSMIMFLGAMLSAQ